MLAALLVGSFSNFAIVVNVALVLSTCAGWLTTIDQ